MALSRQKPSTLLVEPSNAQARIIRDQLEILGIVDYRRAKTGQEALDAHKQRPSQLVLSSMYLPDMTAIELLRELRSRKGGASTAFMLTSSETSRDALLAVRQGGAQALLQKPFSADQLAQALQTCSEFLRPHPLEIPEAFLQQTRVLVVEDSDFYRMIVVRMLSKLGVTNISEAKDGSEAIPLVSRISFDLVITDLHMPEINGGRLIDYIRTKSKRPNVPVLVITAEDDDTWLFSIQEHDISDVLKKPFEPAQVRRVLQAALCRAVGTHAA